MRPWYEEAQIRLCGWVIPAILIAAKASWRVETVINPEAQPYVSGEKPAIFALWHGRMFGLLRGVNPGKTALLISPSNDGEIISRSVRPLGFQTFARGSHKRQGMQAVREIHRLVKQSYSLAFTVDGPRGPRYQVKPGVIRLASQLDIPIIPMAASAYPLLFQMNSAWDAYMGPHFFSRQIIVWGSPLKIPPVLTGEQLQQFQAILEQQLNQATRLLDQQSKEIPR